MSHHFHAKDEIVGVPCGVHVWDMNLSEGTAWGYFVVFPDTDKAQKVRWTATKPMPTADWIVEMGGVADWVGSAGDTLIREAIRNAVPELCG